MKSNLFRSRSQIINLQPVIDNFTRHVAFFQKQVPNTINQNRVQSEFERTVIIAIMQSDLVANVIYALGRKIYIVEFIIPTGEHIETRDKVRSV